MSKMVDKDELDFLKYMKKKGGFASDLKEGAEEMVDMADYKPQSFASESAEDIGKKYMQKAAKQGADLGSVAKKNVLSKVAKSGLKGLGRAASVAAGPLGLMASGVAEAASTEDAGQPMKIKDTTPLSRTISQLRLMDPERRDAFIEANPKLKEMLASDLSGDLAAMKERNLLRGKDTLDRQGDMPEMDLEASRKEREGLQRKKEEQDRMNRSLDNVIEDPSSSSNLRQVLENIRNKQR